jgi:hypothetical protein
MHRLDAMFARIMCVLVTSPNAIYPVSRMLSAVVQWMDAFIATVYSVCKIELILLKVALVMRTAYIMLPWGAPVK